MLETRSRLESERRMSPDAVLREITALEGSTLADLRARWRELFGTSPPGYSRAMLARRLAYRIQEIAFGGLSDRTKAKLEEHLAEAEDGGTSRLKSRKKDSAMPIAGTRLIREWQGRRYEVTVVPGGVEFEGRRYRSLSAVAREITGTRWNGPLFFGLRRSGGGKD